LDFGPDFLSLSIGSLDFRTCFVSLLSSDPVCVIGLEIEDFGLDCLDLPALIFCLDYDPSSASALLSYSLPFPERLMGIFESLWS